MARRPKDLVWSKYDRAYVDEAGEGFSDGEKFSWPREVYINTDRGLSKKQTRHLIKWLQKTLKWLEAEK